VRRPLPAAAPRVASRRRAGKSLHARVAELVRENQARIARCAAVAASKGQSMVAAHGLLFLSAPSAAARDALAGVGPAAGAPLTITAPPPASAAAAAAGGGSNKKKGKGKK